MRLEYLVFSISEQNYFKNNQAKYCIILALLVDKQISIPIKL